MAPFMRRCLPFCVAPVIYMTAVPLHLLSAGDVLKADGLQTVSIATLCWPALLLLAPLLAILVADECLQGRRRLDAACLLTQVLSLTLFLGLLYWTGSTPDQNTAEGTASPANLLPSPTPSPTLRPSVPPAPPSPPPPPALPPPSPVTTTVTTTTTTVKTTTTTRRRSNLRGEASGGGLLPGGSTGRISVVLPCASEGQYALMTVLSFCNRTPDNVLQEILVVDDGSSPPIQELLLNMVEARCRLKVLRHEKTMGLMVAKQTGGDAAEGEFIGFFDCHVAPNRGWHVELIQKLQAKPRRLVVPTITDLDLDAWDEKQGSSSNSKCYISWDAEFMWFDDSSDFIPVVSGGLVAISRDWWTTSGGFDRGMRGWGGENVDQSLRTWLCGGEIVRAKSSRVAHMWRVPQDRRTQAHYHLVQGTDNTGRAAALWFDDFRVKFEGGRLLQHAPNITDSLALKTKLGCQPFAFFLHRFRKVYRDGGMLPHEVFRLRSPELDKCILRVNDRFHLAPCNQGLSTYFHLGNQDPLKRGICCSGIRVWDSMQCFDRLDSTGPLSYYCDVTGHNLNQQYRLSREGIIHHGSGSCLGASQNGALKPTGCETAPRWEKDGTFCPEETTLYEEAVQRYGFSEEDPDN